MNNEVGCDALNRDSHLNFQIDKMRIIYSLFFISFISIFISDSCKQKSDTSYSKEQVEIKLFLNNFKRLLQNAKFDSAALLYVDTAFIHTFNGQIVIESIDSIKAAYASLPNTPNHFRWENTRIDLLNSNVALVTSFFYWSNKNEIDTTRTAYTGLFIKTKNGWKIKHEHESLDMITIGRMMQQSKN